MAWEDNCRTTKVFFDPELRWGEYRTVRVYPTTTFAHLREKLLEKQKSCKDIISCFEIYFKYKGLSFHTKQDFTPHPDSCVLNVLAREEEFWLGSIELTLRDRRLAHAPWRDPATWKKDKQHDPEIPDYLQMFRPSSTCYDMLDPAYSVTNLQGLPIEMDEPHPENLLFEEIENMGMQLGTLERKVKSRDVWRQTYCSLDVDKLWLARPQDAEHMFSFIPLEKDSKVEEEGGYNSFSIASPSISQKTVFRAASKEEMDWWIKAIRHRDSLPAENELIQLADAHICDEESYYALEDIYSLCRCARFEGALSNTAMRLRFQEFLEREHSEELFLFWQHVEAYKLRHPDNPNARNAVSATEAKEWALALYDTFVSENAVHQVSTSGQQLTLIQDNLEFPTWDMFDGPQRAAFGQLRTSSFTRFVQLANYRQYLLNVPFETRKNWRLYGSKKLKHKPYIAFDSDQNAALASQRAVSAARPSTAPSRATNGSSMGFGSFFKRKKAAEEQWNEAVTAVKTRTNEGMHPLEFNWQPAHWWNMLELDEAGEDSLILRLYPGWGPSNFEEIRLSLFAMRQDDLRTIAASIGSVPEFVNKRMMFVRTLGDPSPKLLDERRDEQSILNEYMTRTLLYRQGRSPRFNAIPSTSLLGSVVLHGWVKTIFNRAMQVTKQTPERQTSTRDRRSVIDEENPLNPGITTTPQPEKRFCILTEFEGRGILYFWEHTHSAPTAVLYLESVTAIMPSEIVLHCIEMHDADGVAWCITPDGVDEDDFHAAATRWLATLSRYCAPTATRVTVLQEGPLAKRGKVNTGFKRRWFMLTSSGKMLYFKEENGQCKGEIPIAKIKSVASTGAKDFTFQTPDRTWVFAAETQEDMEIWVKGMKRLCDANTH